MGKFVERNQIVDNKTMGNNCGAKKNHGEQIHGNNCGEEPNHGQQSHEK